MGIYWLRARCGRDKHALASPPSPFLTESNRIEIAMGFGLASVTPEGLGVSFLYGGGNWFIRGTLIEPIYTAFACYGI